MGDADSHYQLLSAWGRGISPPPRGTNAPLINLFRTKDGRHIHLCMDQQRYSDSFCDGVGRPEWKSDPLIATHEAREANATYCIGLVEELFAERTFSEWNEILSGQRGPFDPVQRTGDLANDPQVLANGYLAEVEDDAGRTLCVIAAPVQSRGGPYTTRPAPDTAPRRTTC